MCSVSTYFALSYDSDISAYSLAYTKINTFILHFIISIHKNIQRKKIMLIRIAFRVMRWYLKVSHAY